MAKANDYLHLRAWCVLLGSKEYYLAAQLEQARADHAPDDAIYVDYSTHTWRRFSEVTALGTKSRVEQIVEVLKKNFN